jgi:aryl-alcohol dehydrogenase-like predicted oxidoreductase
LALAWLLSRPGVIPIPGTSSDARLVENAHATEVHLSASEIAQVEQAVPRGAAAGHRYDPAMQKLVNG